MTTLGVIGLGRIGAFHTDTLSQLDGIDGLVVTDERPDVVAQVATKYGVRSVDSVDALLSSGIDGVVVAAATPAHAELTLAAAERGLPTFCEKPVASTAAESARVAEAIMRAGVPVQIGYQRRFDTAFAAAKAAVDRGALGTLHTGHVLERLLIQPDLALIRLQLPAQRPKQGTFAGAIGAQHAQHFARQ